LEEETKRKLERAKMFPRETYNQVIERLLERDNEEILSPRTIRNIERALSDIKAGRVYSTKEVKKRLGIK
ncbi:MAG: hypothetical protein ACTSW3_02090, partial [Promethearchaeota archaeon]